MGGNGMKQNSCDKISSNDNRDTCSKQIQKDKISLMWKAIHPLVPNVCKAGNVQISLGTSDQCKLSESCLWKKPLSELARSSAGRALSPHSSGHSPSGYRHHGRCGCAG